VNSESITGTSAAAGGGLAEEAVCASARTESKASMPARRVRDFIGELDEVGEKSLEVRRGADSPAGAGEPLPPGARRLTTIASTALRCAACNGVPASMCCAAASAE
jgi:hypothetical protein